MGDEHALIVAFSGCSSSGKTTLARLLRDILPNTFILHQDDFYRPEEELPLTEGLLDWDCADAIDIPAMAESLSYIRQHASFPPTLDSKEDLNSVGHCPVSTSTISTLKAKVFSSLPPSHPLVSSKLKLCILDGFLLYPPSMSPIHPYLDLKFFLRTSYEKAKARREARDGYVTIEGFWTDPPGYVDKIVWPNYVSEHGWMFEKGDVEGEYKADVLAEGEIRVMKGEGVDGDMGKVLEWAVDAILAELQKQS